MNNPSRRMPLIDTLKAVASQLIVLHHLAFYGPMSDVAYPLATDGIDWLYEYGRMAVQVFLVIAGFLAARNLLPDATPRPIKPLQMIWSRYCRLAPPFLFAMLAAILAAAVARQWICHSSIPEAPGLMQIASHVLLMQGVLRQDALSAGVWYVAIDFQLFALLTLLIWLAGKSRGASSRLAIVLIATGATASLFYFNLRDTWDNWGIYFFGSYALGVVAHLCSQRKASPAWFTVVLGLVTLALLLDFRLRIAIALGTSLLLGLCTRYDLHKYWPEWRITTWLGKISYSVFLIHFPVCMLVNTLVFRLAPNSSLINLAGMILAWASSIVAGALFYRFVESRVGVPHHTPEREPAFTMQHRPA